MKEDVMNRLEKVLYTAKAHTTGGRAGMSRSADGRQLFPSPLVNCLKDRIMPTRTDLYPFARCRRTTT
jgi:hypothetical protein